MYPRSCAACLWFRISRTEINRLGRPKRTSRRVKIKYRVGSLECSIRLSYVENPVKGAMRFGTFKSIDFKKN